MLHSWTVPHDEGYEEDMDGDVNGVGVVRSIKSELLTRVRKICGLKNMQYLFSDVKQVRHGYDEVVCCGSVAV